MTRRTRRIEWNCPVTGRRVAFSVACEDGRLVYVAPCDAYVYAEADGLRTVSHGRRLTKAQCARCGRDE